MESLIFLIFGIAIGYIYKNYEIRNKYIISPNELIELAKQQFQAGYDFNNKPEGGE